MKRSYYVSTVSSTILHIAPTHTLYRYDKCMLWFQVKREKHVVLTK